VYVRGADGALVFHELVEPNAEDVAEVARRTALRLVKVLKKHGREVDPELGEVDVRADEAGDQNTPLSACYAAAAAGTDLFGERAGSTERPTTMLARVPARDDAGRGCCATCGRSTWRADEVGRGRHRGGTHSTSTR
jgi:hypothetical protein